MFIICLYFTRRFFCPMSSFRNITQFLKELSYNNDSTLRKYSIQVSNVTLDKLLTGLADEVDIVEDDQIKSAVYIIGKNTNSRGQSIWALNDEVFLDENGRLIDDLGAFGFEWLSHLTEGDGINIAKADQCCSVCTPLSSQSFDIMSNFLAGTLEDRCREGGALNVKVSQMFGPGLQFPAIEEGSGLSNDSRPPPVDRCNFLSQFFLASQAVIFANYSEVGSLFNVFTKGHKICAFKR